MSQAVPADLNWNQVCQSCALELPRHRHGNGGIKAFEGRYSGLIDPGTPPRHQRAVRRMARELKNCSSVRRCGFHWSFLAILHGLEHPRSREVWDSLWLDFGVQVQKLRHAELHGSLWPRRNTWTDSRELEEVPEASSVLLLSAHAPGYFQRPDVSPFLQQLRCYATQRGMRFEAKSGPWPVQHETVAVIEVSWNLHQFWATRKPPGEDLSVRNQNLEGLLDDVLAKNHLGRTTELPQWSDLLNVYHDEPKLMVKIWAIEQELSNASVQMVLYLDTDVTIRPDAVHWGLVPHLTRGPDSGHIFVRDSFPGTECTNTGFLAFRNTAVSKRLVELWKQKTNWSMFWDQNSFAESVLELIGMEMEELGRPGYNSECVRYMFPTVVGIVPDTMYCDCWQAKLAEMIGPYRRRHSRLVTFLDPEDVDVNFVPNDIFWQHGHQLKTMHLDRSHKAIMNPLIVHWAGLRSYRLRLARKYLKERFNTSFAEGTCAPPKVSTHRGEFSSNARYIKCCKNLGIQLALTGFVEPREICYWSCCDWKPLNLHDCKKYR